MSGDGAKNYPRVTGDGRWILFIQSAWPAPSWNIYPPTRVMRAPIEGGIAQEIYASPGVAWPQCSISAGCVVWDQRGDKWIVSELDPMRGKGAELATFPMSEVGGSAYILPGGTELAYIVEHQPRNHIRIVSFQGKPTQDILVERATDLENLDPTSDGAGWLSVNHTGEHDELLYITRDGKSHMLWAPERMRVIAAIPSRDSKHLAIHTETTSGNAWLMTGLQK